MGDNDKIRRYKVIETQWEPTEGLRAIEEVEYEEKTDKGKRTTTEQSRLWGFVDDNGELVIEVKYHCVWKFRDGVSKVRLGNKWGAINTSGQEVIPIKYQTLNFTSDGMVQIQFNGQWGCIRRDGTTVIEPKYDYIFPFKGSFAGIKKNNKYGFVNLDGEEIIKPCFDEIGIISPDGSVNVRKRRPLGVDNFDGLNYTVSMTL